MNFFYENLYWLLPIILFDGIMKLTALWKSARNNQLTWFIVLAIINSVGILPLIYIFFFQVKQKS
jgi:hypothetical protein